MVQTIKILIVEDEVITGMYLETMLKKSGFDIIKRVGTGESAINAAQTLCPEIILMDIRLAGKMDGIETAKKIQNTCSCHVIFMTGYQIDGVRRQADEINSCSFIIKPVDINQLIDRIKKYPLLNN
jgi:two-component system, response regulator PdtaR